MKLLVEMQSPPQRGDYSCVFNVDSDIHVYNSILHSLYECRLWETGNKANTYSLSRSTPSPLEPFGDASGVHANSRHKSISVKFTADWSLMFHTEFSSEFGADSVPLEGVITHSSLRRQKSP